MNIRIFTFALMGAVFLFSGSAPAYDLLSPPRTWNSAPTYIVDERGIATVSDDDNGVIATVNAINSNDAWNGAGSGNLISAQSGSVASFQLGDSVPMLNFEDPLKACNGNCLAATFTGYYQSRGDGTWRIFDADIVTNTKRFDWTSESEAGGCSGEFFIEGVQVHETGHGLGLGHTNAAGATMYPSVSSCNNSPASIEGDDIAGINALYGDSGGEGGSGGSSCDLGRNGDPCSTNGECCSGKCRGKSGSKQCR